MSLAKMRNLNIVSRYVFNHLNKSNLNPIRCMSQKSGDVCTKENKNWVSYGFHYKDEKEDKNVHNASYFFSVTICMVFGGFIWAYYPDYLLKDWSQREAYLQLRRREKAGLPPIDPNYVPVSAIKMPSESDLEKVEIVI